MKPAELYIERKIEIFPRYTEILNGTYRLRTENQILLTFGN